MFWVLISVLQYTLARNTTKSKILILYMYMTKDEQEITKKEVSGIEASENQVETPESIEQRAKQEKVLEQLEEARQAEEDARQVEALEDVKIWMGIIRDLEDGQDFDDIYNEFDKRSEEISPAAEAEVEILAPEVIASDAAEVEGSESGQEEGREKKFEMKREAFRESLVDNEEVHSFLEEANRVFISENTAWEWMKYGGEQMDRPLRDINEIFKSIDSVSQEDFNDSLNAVHQAFQDIEEGLNNIDSARGSMVISYDENLQSDDVRRLQRMYSSVEDQLHIARGAIDQVNEGKSEVVSRQARVEQKARQEKPVDNVEDSEEPEILDDEPEVEVEESEVEVEDESDEEVEVQEDEVEAGQDEIDRSRRDLDEFVRANKDEILHVVRTFDRIFKHGDNASKWMDDGPVNDILNHVSVFRRLEANSDKISDSHKYVDGSIKDAFTDLQDAVQGMEHGLISLKREIESEDQGSEEEYLHDIRKLMHAFAPLASRARVLIEGSSLVTEDEVGVVDEPEVEVADESDEEVEVQEAEAEVEILAPEVIASDADAPEVSTAVEAELPAEDPDMDEEPAEEPDLDDEDEALPPEEDGSGMDDLDEEPAEDPDMDDEDEDEALSPDELGMDDFDEPAEDPDMDEEPAEEPADEPADEPAEDSGTDRGTVERRGGAGLDAKGKTPAESLKLIKEMTEELNETKKKTVTLRRELRDASGEDRTRIAGELRELDTKKAQLRKQIKSDKARWDQDWFNAEFQRLGEKMANTADEDEKLRIREQIQDTQKEMAEIGLIAGVVAASELGFGRDEATREQGEQREAREVTEREQRAAEQVAEQTRREEQEAAQKEREEVQAKENKEKAFKDKAAKVGWAAAAGTLGPVGLAGKFVFGLKPIQGSLPTLPRMAVGAWGFFKQMIGQEDLKFGEPSESTKALDKWLEDREKGKEGINKKIGRYKRDKEKSAESASEKDNTKRRISVITDSEKRFEFNERVDKIYLDEDKLMGERKDLEERLEEGGDFEEKGLTDAEKIVLKMKLAEIEKKLEQVQKAKEKLEKDLAIAEKEQKEAKA